MSGYKLIVPGSVGIAPLDALLERARQTAERSISVRTMDAYADSWAVFARWCAARSLCTLPASPETVAAFLQDEADRGRKYATLQARVAAITYFHAAKDRGAEPPTKAWAIRKLLAGLRRTIGTAQNKKAARRVEHLRAMAPALHVRDRAIMLFGFASGLRRSNLSKLLVSDLAFEARGVLVHVRFSKTDQERRGRYIAVHRGVGATCPVGAVGAWCDQRPEVETLFGLSAKGIADVVKRSVAAIGLDPALYAGHSLRAGLVTESRALGASNAAIMRQTGHKKEENLIGYDRPEDAFENNVTKNLGL